MAGSTAVAAAAMPGAADRLAMTVLWMLYLPYRVVHWLRRST